jgi:hypothetical protein
MIWQATSSEEHLANRDFRKVPIRDQSIQTEEAPSSILFLSPSDPLSLGDVDACGLGPEAGPESGTSEVVPLLGSSPGVVTPGPDADSEVPASIAGSTTARCRTSCWNRDRALLLD